MASHKQVSGWVGWVYFAGLLMMLAGIFQSIAGLVAIFKDDVYLVGVNSLLIMDYSQWGWIHLLIGITLFFSAFSLMAGHGWGRFLGAFLASLSAVANFAFLSAYPLWSITVIVLDVLIIYALLVRGGEAKQN